MNMKIDVKGKSYTAIVHEDRDEGGYWADVPELHGCVTQGKTLDELRQQLADAIESWLDAQDPAFWKNARPLTDAEWDAREASEARAGALPHRNPQ